MKCERGNIETVSLGRD